MFMNRIMQEKVRTWRLWGRETWRGITRATLHWSKGAELNPLPQLCWVQGWHEDHYWLLKSIMHLDVSSGLDVAQEMMSFSSTQSKPPVIVSIMFFHHLNSMEQRFSHRLNGTPCQVTATPKAFCNGHGGWIREFSEFPQSPQKESSSKLWDISIMNHWLFMFTEWLFTSLLTEWFFLVIMHENRIWNERYYAVCINLLFYFGMEDFKSCWIVNITAIECVRECAWVNTNSNLDD